MRTPARPNAKRVILFTGVLVDHRVILGSKARKRYRFFFETAAFSTILPSNINLVEYACKLVMLTHMMCRSGRLCLRSWRRRSTCAHRRGQRHTNLHSGKGWGCMRLQVQKTRIPMGRVSVYIYIYVCVSSW